MTTREELLEAIKCCREERCSDCPMLTTICDEMRVDMVDLPEDLVELIEDELASK